MWDFSYCHEEVKEDALQNELSAPDEAATQQRVLRKNAKVPDLATLKDFDIISPQGPEGIRRVPPPVQARPTIHPISGLMRPQHLQHRQSSQERKDWARGKGRTPKRRRGRLRKVIWTNHSTASFIDPRGS